MTNTYHQKVEKIIAEFTGYLRKGGIHLTSFECERCEKKVIDQLVQLHEEEMEKIIKELEGMKRPNHCGNEGCTICFSDVDEGYNQAISDAISVIKKL